MKRVRWATNHKKFENYEKWWDDKGRFVREEWRDNDGKLHKENGPATRDISHSKTHKVKKTEWFCHGLLHNDHGPATIETTIQGINIIIERTWWKNGKRHRDDDLPAIEIESFQTLDENHEVEIHEQQWWKNGLLHRDGDLPAIERLNGDKWWFKRGVQHRDGILPAVVLNGVAQEVWFKNGKLMSLSECIKYENALEAIRKLRNRVKAVSIAMNMTPKKFAKLIQLIKSQQFIEWWWSPTGIGGRRHKKLMNVWIGKNFKT